MTSCNCLICGLPVSFPIFPKKYNNIQNNGKKITIINGKKYNSFNDILVYNIVENIKNNPPITKWINIKKSKLVV